MQQIKVRWATVFVFRNVPITQNAFPRWTATERRWRRSDVALGSCVNIIIIIIIAHTRTFIPMAFETFGPINSKGVDFFNTLGRRISACTGNMWETAFLFQRLSLTIQRFNAICFSGSWNTSAKCVEKVYALRVDGSERFESHRNESVGVSKQLVL